MIFIYLSNVYSRDRLVLGNIEMYANVFKMASCIMTVDYATLLKSVNIQHNSVKEKAIS